MRYFKFTPIIIVFSFAIFPIAVPFSVSAQGGDPVFRAPDTIEGAKEGILNIGDKVMEALPQAIAGIWNERVMPLWSQMGKWAKAEIWEKRVSPAFQTIGDRVKELLGREVEKRKDIVQKELQERAVEYAEQARKGLWERFQALFRKEP